MFLNPSYFPPAVTPQIHFNTLRNHLGPVHNNDMLWQYIVFGCDRQLELVDIGEGGGGEYMRPQNVLC